MKLIERIVHKAITFGRETDKEAVSVAAALTRKDTLKQERDRSYLIPVIGAMVSGEIGILIPEKDKKGDVQPH